MKKYLIAAVIAGALAFGSQANASPAPAAKITVKPVVVTPDTDAVAARRGVLRGIFGRLIELERRKNAWLRRTFLNG